MVCDYVTKLTRAPATMRESDLCPLRRAGLDDRAILDLVHIAGFFAHANRLADALGCDLEDGMRPRS